jgi:hypothetical protein
MLISVSVSAVMNSRMILEVPTALAGCSDFSLDALQDKEMLRYVKLCARECDDRAWRTGFGQVEVQAMDMTETCQTLISSQCTGTNGYY